MMIEFYENTKEFHIHNDFISYIIQVFENGHLGNLYFGKRIQRNRNFSHLLQTGERSMAIYQKEQVYDISFQHTKMEYPVYGTGDFRFPALEIEQENGSRITDFRYESHKIYSGKTPLKDLPSLYVERKEEAETLEINLWDEVCQARLTLCYTIYQDAPVICRNTRVKYFGDRSIRIQKIFSTSLDLPDSDYEMIQLSGAWARERYPKMRKLQQGIQGFGSTCGCSSAEHNPFLILKRPYTTEDQGEALGFSLIYSGNHMEQVEVSTHDITRVLQGIQPETFCWPLHNEEEFQSPESLIVYSDQGLNQMSQVLHRLYQRRLVRGSWREKERPILINNWEATEMDFTEEKILQIAKKAKDLGVELFVLDDGWFGNREDDTRGLGDWYVTNFQKLPNGMKGLAEKIVKLGMGFGIWIEPEMVNKDSELYRKHPEWLLQTPNRTLSPGRNQYVLDFTNPDVAEYIYGMIKKILQNAPISYVKWDMNRYITECYSLIQLPEEQGTVFHKYILAVYRFYERLIKEFPQILFESCASGGARFDAGMLYYAPQAWTSDDTDAIERLKIQYGTSYAYPISSMGAHVSAVPNQQVGRTTSLITRGNVAMFGAYGYELDLNELSVKEQEVVKQQILFMKKHRRLLQYGTFYRIHNPFTEQKAAWIMVSEDKSRAMLGYYRILGTPNKSWDRVYVKGLDEDKIYRVNEDDNQVYYGSELMYAGFMLEYTGERGSNRDFTSELYYFEALEKEKYC